MAKLQGTETDSDLGEARDPSPRDGTLRDYSTYLKKSSAERRLLDERLAEADKGVFISGEAMHRWIESWGTESELPPPEPDIFPKTNPS